MCSIRPVHVERVKDIRISNHVDVLPRHEVYRGECGSFRIQISVYVAFENMDVCTHQPVHARQV